MFSVNEEEVVELSRSGKVSIFDVFPKPEPEEPEPHPHRFRNGGRSSIFTLFPDPDMPLLTPEVDIDDMDVDPDSEDSRPSRPSSTASAASSTSTLYRVPGTSQSQSKTYWNQNRNFQNAHELRRLVNLPSQIDSATPPMRESPPILLQEEELPTPTTTSGSSGLAPAFKMTTNIRSLTPEEFATVAQIANGRQGGAQLPEVIRNLNLASVPDGKRIRSKHFCMFYKHIHNIIRHCSTVPELRSVVKDAQEMYMALLKIQRETIFLR